MSEKYLTSNDSFSLTTVGVDDVDARAASFISMIGSSPDTLGRFYGELFRALGASDGDHAAMAAIGLKIYEAKGGLTRQQAQRLTQAAARHSSATKFDLSQALSYLGLARLHVGVPNAVASPAFVDCFIKAGIDAATVRVTGGERDGQVLVAWGADLEGAMPTAMGWLHVDGDTWSLRHDRSGDVLTGRLQGPALGHDVVRDIVLKVLGML